MHRFKLKILNKRDFKDGFLNKIRGWTWVTIESKIFTPESLGKCNGLWIVYENAIEVEQWFAAILIKYSSSKLI